MPVKSLFIHISDACSAVCVLFQACHGGKPFLFGEKFGISRCVRHKKETNDSKNCRYDALDWLGIKSLISIPHTNDCRINYHRRIGMNSLKKIHGHRLYPL